jgi:hypothetical protein
MADDALILVRRYIASGAATDLEVVAASAVAPVCAIIEASCDVIDRSGYAMVREHVVSVVSQRLQQSHIAERIGTLSDADVTRAFQEMCAAVTREVSFALLRREVIRPKPDSGNKLADELRVKKLLVSCEYSTIGWMWVERILTSDLRAQIPQDHYHAVRHELYYICVVEAVRMHRALELNNFSYRNVHRVLDKIAAKARECIANGCVPQFKKSTLMGKSRPLFQRIRTRSDEA